MHLKRFFPLYIFLFALIIRLIFLLVTYQGKEQVAYFEDVGIAINLLDGAGYSYKVFTRISSDIYTRPNSSETPYVSFLSVSLYSFFSV